MFKKTMCMLLTMVMLLTLVVPAAGAEETSSKPTVEEILNSYHEKAFALQTSGETESPAAYSRSGGSQKTLEQETVDELTAAGYEAYNITAENYDALEESLKTDFAAMGMDPNESYIIVISGEDPEETASSNSRLGSLPEQDIIDDGGVSSSSFNYTYNGVTHKMRYTTVSPTMNSGLVKSGSGTLFETAKTTISDYIQEVFENFIRSSIVYLIDSATQSPAGTIGDMLVIEPEQVKLPEGSIFTIDAEARWTRLYTQIYDEHIDSWMSWSSTDYVTVTTEISAEYYDMFEETVVTKYKKDISTRYCEHYNDFDWRKSMAARGWYYGQQNNEWVGHVKIYNPQYVGSLTPQELIITLPQTQIPAP